MENNEPKLNPNLDEIRLEPETEAMVRTILKNYDGDPYSRQKLILDFYEHNTPKPEKRIYPRNFPIIYAAARNEKLMFLRILKDVVDYLNIPQRHSGNGRPSAVLKDILKCLCIQSYCGLSHWRIESELKIARELRIIDNIYRKSALCKYLNKEEISYWLQKIYQTIVIPIATIETIAAVDATGMSVQYGRKRWIEIRDDHQLHKDYKKLHILSGTKSNAIYFAEITDGNVHESPRLKYLLDGIKDKFSFQRLVADPGYLSKRNTDLISQNGMQPIILPKRNVRSVNRGSDGSWGKMIWFFKNNPELFLMYYHARSNVESTFSMLKRKFGYELRSKSSIGQSNEILAKIVCLNASILGEAILEFQLRPQFMDN